jgi:hypothetical protein
MKWISSAIVVLALSVWGLAAQTTAKPAPKAPAKSQPAPQLTDQEKNLRAYIELLRSDIKQERTEIMSAVMQLDSAQSVTFWPIYKEFETEYTGIGNGTVALVKEYASNYDNMTGAVADKLALQLLDLEKQRTDLKRKYYDKFKTALDPITAARFLQVENQLEQILNLQIAAGLPVISGGGQK